jgi:hypothetical protein
VQVFTGDGVFVRQWPLSAWKGGSAEDKPCLALDGEGPVYVTDPEGYRSPIYSKHSQASCTEMPHSEQGVQYAAAAHTRTFQDVPNQHANVSRARQNGYVERLIQMIKQEVDPSEYGNYHDAYRQLGRLLNNKYIHKRLHSALGYLAGVQCQGVAHQEGLPHGSVPLLRFSFHLSQRVLQGTKQIALNFKMFAQSFRFIPRSTFVVTPLESFDSSL